ncbi:MAG: PDZ domain-containing protein [Pirellulaceae bacterium]|nr:PDZ domain-containing protein [Pirellulaceae bacterium]
MPWSSIKQFQTPPLLIAIMLLATVSVVTAEDTEAPLPQPLSKEQLTMPAPISYWIGVRCTNTGTPNNLKVIVADVIPKAPAATAGIVSGDEIVSVDATPLASVEQLGRLVERSNGKRLSVQIRRKETLINVQLKPTNRTSINYTIPSGMNSEEMASWIEKQASSGFGPGINLRFMNPGIVLPTPKPEFPLGIEFRISRVGTRTQIAVRKGGNEWIVTPESIDTLPPETQRWATQLQHLASGQHAFIHSMPTGLNFLLPPPQRDRKGDTTSTDLEAENKKLAGDIRAMNQRMERLQQIIRTLQSQQTDSNN